MAVYQIAEILGLTLALALLLLVGRYLYRPLSDRISAILQAYRERAEADARAEALLTELLAPSEYEQLRATGYLEVRSRLYPGRLYRIPAHGGLVGLYEDGVLLAGLCAQPQTRLPGPDVVAMHKLMIEGNEEEYLGIANHLKPWMFYSTRRRHYRY